MNNTIQIRVQQQTKGLEIREFDGQRVVTFKDIDDLHRRPEGTASRNFRENRERFLSGTDFHDITPENFNPTKFVALEYRAQEAERS